MKLSSSQQELIKWFAVVLMIADHAAWAFLPNGSAEQWAVRSVTALAFPLYALLTGYNVTVRGVPVARYWKPLLLLLVLAQLPYALLINPARLSIAGTFLLGLVLLEGLTRAARPIWVRVLMILGALVLSDFVDYGLRGVLLVTASVLFWQGSAVGFRRGWGWVAGWLGIVAVGMFWNPLTWFVGLLAPLVFIGVARSPVRIQRMPSRIWLYWYPVHMAIIVLVARL